SVGGLVGFMGTKNGTTTTVSIYRSYATGQVSATNQSFGGQAGGLVGLQNGGSISQSFATRAVSGYNDAALGGLCGIVASFSSSSIVDSYATGSVTQTNINGGSLTGTGEIGGLVGGIDSSSSITTSYATGALSGSNPGGENIGGLVGTNLFGAAISKS